MKTYTARQIASYFIKKSDENTENDLTNLKLQKILYYAQAEHIRKYSIPLFSDVIEAWAYGPVINDIYQWLKGCGAYSISSFDIDVDSGGIGKETTKFLDEIWEKYSKYSPFYLVNKTHDPSDPWEAAQKDRLNNVIDLEMLKTVKLQDEWS